MMTKEEITELLRNSDCMVKFTKVDGSLREMKCTLKKEVISEHFTAPAEGKKPRKENPDVVCVWDLEKNEWRSFRIASVISIEAI